MKKALGKGLSALIPDSYMQAKVPAPAATPTRHAVLERPEPAGFALIPLAQIRPNHDQPRKVFPPEEIQELAASIKEKGILQPIVVTRVGEKQYELICGERRFRAAEICGLQEIPAVIKDLAGHDFLEWALIENIQRQDLNALEEAEAYQRLADERMLGHEEIAKRLGKSRTAVTNTMRLLRLPTEVQALIANGSLAAGHARALLGLLTPEHQRQLARRIAEEKLSVRQVEAIVNRSQAHKRKAKTARQLNQNIVDLERRLMEHFGTQVKIYPRKDQTQGRLEIHYYSLDDLDRILQRSGLPQG